MSTSAFQQMFTGHWQCLRLSKAPEKEWEINNQPDGSLVWGFRIHWEVYLRNQISGETIYDKQTWYYMVLTKALKEKKTQDNEGDEDTGRRRVWVEGLQ